jgi:metal-sulfur cluster biosynthetic enzyme
MITKDTIYTQLRQIIDPELHLNIVDLGLIYEIVITEESGLVEITMTLTTPGCPLSFVFEEWIPDAVKKIEGVKDVKINLVWEPPWDPDKISDDAKEELGMIR